MTKLSKYLCAAFFVCNFFIVPVAGRTQGFLTGQPIDGVHCDRAEGSVVHIHQHLWLYARGAQQTVPGQIGIPPAGECLYWLHTHSDDGIIHVESPVRKVFTLGQFFDIWGEPLGATVAAGVVARRGGTLKVWVNGNPLPASNLRSLVLRNKTDIVIMSAPPSRKLSRRTDWKALNL